MTKMFSNALLSNENWSGKTETFSDFCSLTRSKMIRLIFYLHSVPHKEKNLKQIFQFGDKI